MLKIYVPEFSEPPSGVEIISDVEEVFTRIPGGIPDDDIVRNLIRTIEQGEYYDRTSFRDRFGKILDFEHLSTGCKAAICTHCLSDKIISTYECCANAITAIIWYCTQGSILLEFDYHGITTLGAPQIDASLNGYHFSNAQSLVTYMENIFPDDPPRGMAGVTAI